MQCAGRQLRLAFDGPLELLLKSDFMRAWSSLAYLYPNLHPDSYEEAGSGWPRKLKRIAAEAWRRAGIGGISEEELYPSDAQWAGLYDRINSHTDEEMNRRKKLAAMYGEKRQ